MTKKRMELLVAAWARRLGLAHWEIKCDWKNEAPEDVLAQCRWSHDYDHASIRFDPAFAGWAPRYAEATIVHELIHVLARDLQVTLNTTVESLPRGARGLAADLLNHEIEGVVDRLADAMVGMASLTDV